MLALIMLPYLPIEEAHKIGFLHGKNHKAIPPEYEHR